VLQRELSYLSQGSKSGASPFAVPLPSNLGDVGSPDQAFRPYDPTKVVTGFFFQVVK